MSDAPTVLLVGDGERLDEAADAIRRAAGTAGASVERGRPGADSNAVDADCVVHVGDPAAVDGHLAAAVRERGLPLVAYTASDVDAARSADAVTDYVRAGPNAAEHLADRVRWAVDGAGASGADAGGGSDTGCGFDSSDGADAGDGASADIESAAATELRESRRKIERLLGATTKLVGCHSEQTVCELAVSAAERILDFDTCSVSLREGEQLVPRAWSSDTGLDDVRAMSVDEGIVGRTYRTGESQLTENIAADEDAEPVREEFRSAISVPIGDVGVFQAVSDWSRAFDERDLRLAELLIAYVEETLERVRVETELRESREKIERLHEIGTELVACETEGELCRMTVDAAERVLDFDISVVNVEEDGLLPILAASSQLPPGGAEAMSVDEGIAGETYRTGESFLVDDVREVAVANPQSEEYRSLISVPLGDVGVFQAVSTEPSAFDEDDLDMAELLASHAGETLERVRAETALREREADLVEERDRLVALFENVPDPAVSYEFEDEAPVVRAVNSRFESVFGFSEAELLGENIDEYIVPPKGDDEASSLNETLQAGESLQTESRRLTKSGVRDFLLHVVPLSLGERNLQGYAIYTDITDRKERERELERQNDRLDQFASIVSHDLRNPLNVAQGYAELAREEGDGEQFDRVEAAHDRMVRLIDDLLSLAQQGEVVGETAPVTLESTVERAWADVATSESTLRLGDLGTVDADRDRLVELFENLFRNAVEHAGDDVVVRVDATADGFCVADDGPGVPDDRKDSVFDPGYTTGDDGTGLGLAIVEQIASAHGWDVTVTDAEGGGARFVVATA